MRLPTRECENGRAASCAGCAAITRRLLADQPRLIASHKSHVSDGRDGSNNGSGRLPMRLPLFSPSRPNLRRERCRQSDWCAGDDVAVEVAMPVAVVIRRRAQHRVEQDGVP
jgi:hypothetical protein